ncbi:MAG TPA: glycosyltransferase, partial [Oceanospirillales bacterium]|nr:glycosyltransferase [Oceanospirillales bacterium]
HRIVWIGLQTCMADLYAIADVLVSTSKKPESFGRTVLEALAVGTPVVAYNHGGVAEILAELYPQGAVSFGNTQQLSDKINRVLNSEQQPMPKVPDKFLLENMLQQTEQLYRECCHAE